MWNPHYCKYNRNFVGEYRIDKKVDTPTHLSTPQLQRPSYDNLVTKTI